MNKQEKLLWISIVAAGVAFVIVTLVMFGLYLAIDEQRVATIATENVPYNAVEDAAVKNQSIYWKGNVYKPKELKSIMVPDVNYFKVNPMDSIKFSVDYKFDDNNGRSTRSTTVFVRGVKYNELPFIYDYEREIDLKPHDIVCKYGARYYDLEELKVSKSPPWVINAKYQKVGLLMGMLGSAILGLFVSISMWIMTIIVMAIATIITITKALKKERRIRKIK